MHWLQRVCIFAEWDWMCVWIIHVRVHRLPLTPGTEAGWLCVSAPVISILHGCLIFCHRLSSVLCDMLRYAWATHYVIIINFCLHLIYSMCWSLTSGLYIFQKKENICFSIFFISVYRKCFLHLLLPDGCKVY